MSDEKPAPQCSVEAGSDYECDWHRRVAALEAQIAEREAEAGRLRENYTAFLRELLDLQHEVAKACQASGTMLTDLQPEAMTIVAEVCRVHLALAEDEARLDWADALQEDFNILIAPGETLREAIDAAREVSDD